MYVRGGEACTSTYLCKRGMHVYAWLSACTCCAGAASPFSAPSGWVRVGDPVAHFEEKARESKVLADAKAAAAVASAAAATYAYADAEAAAEAAAELPSEAHLAQLQELGLDRAGAVRALRETGGGSVAAAVDWYFASYTPDPQLARPADDVGWLFS